MVSETATPPDIPEMVKLTADKLLADVKVTILVFSGIIKDTLLTNKPIFALGTDRVPFNCKVPAAANVCTAAIAAVSIAGHIRVVTRIMPPPKLGHHLQVSLSSETLISLNCTGHNCYII